VALVLGAGGVTGWAWLVGALAALERHSGWDPRRAGVIVGTSAGSGVAAMLRAGLSAADQYAQYVDQPVSAAGQAVLDRLDAPSNASGPAARGGEAARSGDRTPLNPLLAVRGMLRWPPRPGLALAGLAPRGGKPLGSLPHRLRAAHATWPAEALWITSVRVSDGRRMVFGRDPSRVDVGTAVEASCAVPGFFQPVEVDGADHVDGGAWSATNADLTAGLGFETVVVIAPLSADRDALGWSLGHARRAYHRANLSREAGIASDAGSEVHRIEPGRADLAVLTGNELDGARRREIAEQGFASMRSRLDAGSPLAGALG
jgi:NTE family protein